VEMLTVKHQNMTTLFTLSKFWVGTCYCCYLLLLEPESCGWVDRSGEDCSSVFYAWQ